jgi:hypothetical protein
MTDIQRKAMELANSEGTYKKALFRAIEQHEAFKQKVSDAAEVYEEMGCPVAWEGFEQFIIPKPKPDPLVEILAELNWITGEAPFRAALDAAGFEIREKSN